MIIYRYEIIQNWTILDHFSIETYGWKPPYPFCDSQTSQVRVLDVDALPLEEIHRAFMYTLVRRRPAEAFRPWGLVKFSSVSTFHEFVLEWYYIYMLLMNGII